MTSRRRNAAVQNITGGRRGQERLDPINFNLDNLECTMQFAVSNPFSSMDT